MIATHLRIEGSKGKHHHGEVCTEGQVADEDEPRFGRGHTMCISVGRVNR